MEINKENFKLLSALYEKRDTLLDTIDFFNGEGDSAVTVNNEFVPAGTAFRAETQPWFREDVRRFKYREGGGRYSGEKDFPIRKLVSQIPECEMILGILHDAVLRQLHKELHEVDNQIKAIQ